MVTYADTDCHPPDAAQEVGLGGEEEREGDRMGLRGKGRGEGERE